MLKRFFRQNLYWLLITGALTLALVYAYPNYICDRQTPDDPIHADSLLGTPVHVNFENVPLNEALTAVAIEAHGTLDGWHRPAENSEMATEQIRRTIHNKNPVSLREAIYMLIASPNEETRLFEEYATWDESGIIFIGGSEQFYNRSLNINVYDVSNLVAGLDELDREKQMVALTRLIENGTLITGNGSTPEQPYADSAHAYYFNDKLIAIADSYCKERVDSMLLTLRSPHNAALHDLFSPEDRLLKTLVRVNFDNVRFRDALNSLSKQAHCTIIPYLDEYTGSAARNEDRLATAHASSPIPLKQAIDILVDSIQSPVPGIPTWKDPYMIAWQENRAIYVGPPNDFYPHPPVTFVYNFPYSIGKFEEKDSLKLRNWVETGIAKFSPNPITVRFINNKFIITADPETQKALADWIKSWAGL